ncbi:hypothetical protein pEaSNUABM20_00162 [Erwinia phage pEa_SNUABM_20]|uniref:J domain-containing protein n=1 Tax=Erwinia phage pEa_SNUABM_3 TaxID=2869552 RepID=A0AAE7XJW1_9CAUD|nr:hypothetical protein MPK68_gp162 [Erwinia phage pEa_SNUABM_3]QZE56359.1 hypothetical protein pEaSNUABM3_00162 [Erwinia phage pEa_SNUABM_3]QZE56698.1 hypothetical protein pEaSNUABM20_00162 [Erwinia phage pEa_SNUABM_20]
MTNTQLMVIPQQTALIISDVAFDEEAEFEALESEGGETLEEILEEVAALELRYSADCERVTKIVDKLNKNNKPLIMEIERANAELQALLINMAESDDLEDKANAEDLQKLLDDNFEQEDTDHETRDNEADADTQAEHERWSRAELIRKCKAIYKAIARMTHPDKCRNLSDDEQLRRRELFLNAKQAVARLDYEGLDLIHIELCAKSHEPLNLIQRLLRARERRENLYRKMQALRQSNEWQLFTMAFHYGETVADENYRVTLEQTLEGLRQMIAHARGAQSGNNSNNHWV